MTTNEIDSLISEAKEAYGSASAERLGRLVERLLTAVVFLLELVRKKDDELTKLRAKTFGSTSEKKGRAEAFIEASQSDSSSRDDDDSLASEDKEAIKEKVRRLKAEARKLERRMRSKEDKRLSIGPEVAEEVVRRPLPADFNVVCPICEEAVRDGGLSHRAKEIDVLESAFIKREYLLHKGECACGSLRFVMPGPDRGVEKTNYSPRFVARLIFDKFALHLPCHRQAKAMALQGLKVPRDTVVGLILKAYVVLSPVIERIRETNRAEIYQHCDESPVRTVIGGKKKTQYLWCLVTDKAVSFSVSEQRNKKEARLVVGDSRGVLTSDRLNIYWDLVSAKTESACMAHCRRYFWYALASFPDESIKIIRLIGKLYKIEAKAKQDKLGPAERLSLRQEHSTPILEQIKSAISAMDPPPRSALGEAVSYTLKHWPELTYFLRDGKVSIDNNACEGELRRPKLGFKNFLFTQSKLGSDAVAGLYTLIATCIKHGVNPVDYLADVLAKLNRGWLKTDIDDLMPWKWSASHPKAAEPRPVRVEHLDSPTVIKLVRAEGRIAKLKAKRALP